jgi:hypothetical protein
VRQIGAVECRLDIVKRIIDTSEVLGTVELPNGTYEVCATADANYDDDAKQLIVRLNSFLRTTNLRAKEELSPADWLPKGETVTESMDPDEAVEAARDIFHRWAQKVRNAGPLHNPIS